LYSLRGLLSMYSGTGLGVHSGGSQSQGRHQRHRGSDPGRDQRSHLQAVGEGNARDVEQIGGELRRQLPRGLDGAAERVP
jgi:hypothetical protein